MCSKSNSIFYPSSISRTAATSRSMLGKCSTEALRHQDQVNLNPSSVTLNHFRWRRRHLVVREVPRSNRFLLPLQNVTDMADNQIYLCKNIAKTGSYYHGPALKMSQTWQIISYICVKILLKQVHITMGMVSLGRLWLTLKNHARTR